MIKRTKVRRTASYHSANKVGTTLIVPLWFEMFPVRELTGPTPRQSGVNKYYIVWPNGNHQMHSGHVPGEQRLPWQNTRHFRSLIIF